MENELISKKDLLELAGISYGQLYRWKRKMLIPEDWFVRKSTFTGQETFFPRDKILSRIQKIKNMKTESSLDDLADILSPEPADVFMDRNRIVNEKIASEQAMQLFEETLGHTDVLDFEKLLAVYVLDKLLQSGEISSDEGKSLLKILSDHYGEFQGKNCDLLLIRKLGVSNCILLGAPNQIVLDSGSKPVVRLNLVNCVEELKPRVTSSGNNSEGGKSNGRQ
ncbi:MAG TPA: YhbD family protein [Candidatus Kryptonia bacterium]